MAISGVSVKSVERTMAKNEIERPDSEDSFEKFIYQQRPETPKQKCPMG
jgi:hypothetical protein